MLADAANVGIAFDGLRSGAGLPGRHYDLLVRDLPETSKLRLYS